MQHSCCPSICGWVWLVKWLESYSTATDENLCSSLDGWTELAKYIWLFVVAKAMWVFTAGEHCLMIGTQMKTELL